MLQGQNGILVIHLGSDIAVDSLQILCKKPSSLEFEELEFETGDIEEAELGYYNIPLTATFLSEVGTHIFKIDGYQIEQTVQVEVVPKPLSSSPPPGVCIIMGNVRNIAGRVDAFEQIGVTVRPLKLPKFYAGNLVLGKRLMAYTDFNGFFSIPVIQGSVVIFEIPDAGVRFQATIPEQESVQIEDLIPADS